MKPKRSGACDQPLDVDPFEGEVVITGPGHVAIALTPSAAAQTAERLAAAVEALQSRSAAHSTVNPSRASDLDD
jgi:hypothetical protein